MHHDQANALATQSSYSGQGQATQIASTDYVKVHKHNVPHADRSGGDPMITMELLRLCLAYMVFSTPRYPPGSWFSAQLEQGTPAVHVQKLPSCTDSPNTLSTPCKGPNIRPPQPPRWRSHSSCATWCTATPPPTHKEERGCV